MSATIAARAHSSSRLSAPARRPAPMRRKTAWLARIGRMVGRRPGRALVLLLFTAVAGAILVNALMFQKVRHPAPIAAAPSPAQPVRQAERPVERRAETPAPLPATAPVPPVRPSDLSQATRETQGRSPAAVTSVPRSAAAPAAVAPAPVARTAAARDPIADLINGGDIRPPAEIRANVAAKAAPVRRTIEN